MVPSHIVLLDKLPITLNGKIDIRNLPDINSKINSFIAPESNTEKIVAKMLQNILGNDNSFIKIGKNSNFFDLGCDSLSTIRLISEIYNKFKISIDIKDVFQYPTIEGLSNLIDDKIDSNNVNMASPLSGK